jgi:general secretion pathway protein C
MSSRWTGFFVWALVTACAALWGFKIFAATRPVPANATLPEVAPAAQGPMTRLFGAVVVPQAQEEAPKAAESDRFQLFGVIAPRNGGAANAYAIVGIDGQPPLPWKVGAELQDNVHLLSVGKRSAEFGPAGGPAAFTLELPEPAPPETGTLPTAVSQPNGTAPVPRAATPAPVQPQFQPQVGMPIPGAVRGQMPPGGPNRPGLPLRPQAYQPGMIPPGAVPPGRTMPTAPGVQQPNPAVQDGQPQKEDE